MKLPDVILLSLSVAFIIMGIHQNMTVGFGSAYWLIMVSCVLLFIYIYRKSSNPANQNNSKPKEKGRAPKKKK